ncbi:transcriptional regulator/antitoxin, MazE [Caballeronia terrestris]|jgi:antitoxin MazE|uniref:Transcriptional regulator/antitoxin, MazE n=1 Tax=Caballeronia terrestris TaxID=1226301 RepID=A0A158K0U5_9BURK|nr:AbrB/MazE/SpoVT family DNA-binding domain-containing protein [Caballeronia terrestris]SAL74772.1 transcriptional regulator/antitoxin, MazE [Caballeronia terrestris]
MRTTLPRIGNSQGVLIPKPILARLGIENEVEMRVENDALVPRRPPRNLRDSWAEASEALAREGDDTLLLGEFPNDNDAELRW